MSPLLHRAHPAGVPCHCRKSQSYITWTSGSSVKPLTCCSWGMVIILKLFHVCANERHSTESKQKLNKNVSLSLSLCFFQPFLDFKLVKNSKHADRCKQALMTWRDTTEEVSATCMWRACKCKRNVNNNSQLLQTCIFNTQNFEPPWSLFNCFWTHHV